MAIGGPKKYASWLQLRKYKRWDSYHPQFDSLGGKFNSTLINMLFKVAHSLAELSRSTNLESKLVEFFVFVNF